MHILLKIVDRTLNGIVSLLIILALLYSAWAVYDVSSVYLQADSHFAFVKSSNELSLAEYENINSDVCALISIPNTGINYPVVQGETNDEYLNKSVYGKYLISGSIFIDSRNSKNFSDKYTLFYGHRMNASAMFGDIARYTETEFFNEHKNGTITLPDKTLKVDFFACVKCLSSLQIFFDVETANSDIEGVMKEIKKRAVQRRETAFTGKERIIALSTCESSTTSGRIILFGILKGE